jgi:hypothetical protein
MTFGEYVTFRRMITPRIIQVLFVLLSCTAVVAGALYVMDGFLSEANLFIWTGLALFFLGPLAIRICTELLILLFRINETLSEIRERVAQKTTSQ